MSPRKSLSGPTHSVSPLLAAFWPSWLSLNTLPPKHAHASGHYCINAELTNSQDGREFIGNSLTVMEAVSIGLPALPWLISRDKCDSLWKTGNTIWRIHWWQQINLKHAKGAGCWAVPCSLNPLPVLPDKDEQTLFASCAGTNCQKSGNEYSWRQTSFSKEPAIKRDSWENSYPTILGAQRTCFMRGKKGNGLIAARMQCPDTQFEMSESDI